MFYNTIEKKMKQIANTIMMIEPIAFRYNEQTSVNNYYQKDFSELNPENAQRQALVEFKSFVKKLEDAGIDVIVFKDTNEYDTPDSIFPNNWISTHNDGSIFLYPMFARNRREERRIDIIKFLQDNFEVKKVFDNTTFYENKNLFLEGTGSMVLDRENKIAYASISERTNKGLFKEWCSYMKFTPISFSSNQLIGNNKNPIYHTNVMMCIADNYAIICLESIDNNRDRDLIVQSLEETNKEIIEISKIQKNRFAGNMLQLVGNKKYLVMSEMAFNSLTEHQKVRIKKYNSILHSSLDTIESCGGGSARCMMSEVFLSHIK